MINSSTSADRLVLLIIGAVTLFALVLVLIFAVNEQKQSKNSQNVAAYSLGDQERPQVRVLESFADLGTVSVKEEKTATFIIENIGKKPLQLFNIKSSCDCTYGKLTIERVDSPEFNMHSKSSWAGTVESGKKSTLSVIYRPYIMPVKGIVSREVYVQTNDPEKERLTFTIKAIVE